VAVPDMEAGEAFYGAVFGWEANPGDGGESMPYAMFTSDGKLVAGMGPLSADQIEAGQPPVWSCYIMVDDIDAVHARAVELGATPLMEPMQILDTGKMSFILDPTGAAVGFWQSGTHDGAEIFNVPGAVTWNELATTDTGDATAFYGELLGWESEAMEMDGGSTYWTFSNAGRMNGGTYDMAGIVPDGTPSHWMTYFCVDDCDAVAARISEHGGAVLSEPTDFSMGRMAVVADPFGATFTIMAGSQFDDQPPR
nr:VOC family protein [Acidimicrobiia bacterium]